MKKAESSMLRAVFSALLLVLLCGCGTMMSRAFKDGFLIESPTPPAELIYGGTKDDIRAIGICFTDFPRETIKLPFLIIDLPLSFCADTLLLPLTLYEKVKHDREVEKRKRGSGGQNADCTEADE